MATTIKLKNSVTTTNAPSSLVQGEVAINITDKKVWVGNAATTPIQLLGDGGSVQFTTVDTTNLQVTNIKAKDGTASASIANSTGALTVAAAFSANGGATLGDASGDALTINSSAVSIPNGLNFDSNTFVIDATNNNVGIGTSSPTATLQVAGNTKLYNPSGNVGLTLRNSTSGDANGVTFSIAGSTAYYENATGAMQIGTTTSNQVEFKTSNTERMRIDGSGNVMIGTTSTSNLLHINKSTAANTFLQVQNSLAIAFYGLDASGNAYCWNQNNLPVLFGTNDLERMRIDSSGNVGIGSSAADSSSRLTVSGISTTLLDASGSLLRFNKTAGTDTAWVSNRSYGWHNGNGLAISTQTADDLKFGTNSTERMRITSGGDVLVGKTASNYTVAGIQLNNNGELLATRNGVCFSINRLTTDGNLIDFYQDGTLEGNISVSGTTVSYNGGHLARWSQLPDNSKDDTILKGTVMSNLDDMCVWVKDGEELPNEQLNKMKVSDVEGDTNVAGVFVNWTFDEQCQSDDMNIAMTGDMIIRIAEGVVVQKGDLLMSAGDGTAKPQGDDIVRSKTVAKVTSNHVTCTYADGSYCVPCVLMAC